MREGVVLDVLDTEGAVVDKAERGGGEETEDVGDEDAELIFVLGGEEGGGSDDDAAFEVGAIVCG